MEKFTEKFNKRVEEQEEKPFEADKKTGENREIIEEIEKYKSDGQKIIDSYKNFFITYAKDVSLKFRMSDSFYIDLQNGEVNLDTKWFAEKGFSKDQILWACLHELSHFRDLAEDPEKMLGNFEYIRTKAKKTGEMILKKWEEKYGASDPEFIERLKKQIPISKNDPSKTMSAVERSAYKIHHTFYNIFDDIYVNNLVARKASKYESDEEGGKDVEKLYKEKLFAERDYSDLPRHMQFTYKLIREEMVKEEDVAVADELRELMKQKIKFYGKEYSPKEVVDNFIKSKGGRDTKAGQRYLTLQRTLEPIFEDLLKKDIEKWDPQKSDPKQEESGGGEGERQQSSGNPFEQDYQEYEKNNPDKISDEDIENWANKNEKDKKEKEAQKAKAEGEENKSAEEKSKETQENIDKEWCAKNNVDYRTLQNYRKMESEVEPYLADLSRLWQKIIFGSAKEIQRGMEGHFKAGAELDIQKVIEDWPKIEKADIEETKIFKKMTEKEILVKKPELIRVRLVGDMSGSMDSAKRHILQQCFVLLLSSLREFNTYLNMTRSDTKSKLEADTEAWIFGNNAKKVKKLRSESGYDDEQVEIVKIFEKLQNTIGGTYDNKALEEILNSLTLEDKEKIGQEKIMEMVFEITDGGSSDAEAARSVVNKLTETGVIARAFQIGSASADDNEVFNNVWNKNREEKLGEIVGDKIENLLPAITELLKKYLSGVRL